MGHALREGVSFCIVADRAIFLDVLQDRYFCLPADLENAFLKVISGREELDDWVRLEATSLVRSWPGTAMIAPCSASTVRQMPDLLDTLPRAPAITTANSVAHLCAATLRLHFCGFARLLRHFSKRKARTRQRPHDDVVLGRTLAGHVATRLFMTTQDRCLLRSIALAHQLLDVGQDCQIVLAVQLQPFRAHCWVQRDDRLVNERFEVAREFTPILVL